MNTKDYETTRGLLLKARYDRGLENNMGLYVEVGAPLSEIEVSRRHQKTGRAKGMTDPVLGVTKLNNIKNGQLYYGGQFVLSLGERIWATEREDGNLTSGGHTLTGFLGYQKDQKTHILGGRAHYDIRTDRTESFKFGRSKINVSKSKGNVLGLEGYMERPQSKWMWGGLVGLDLVQGTGHTFKVGGGRIDLETDAYNMMRLGTYGKFQVKGWNQLEVIPSLQYVKVLGGSGGSYTVEDSTEQTELALTGRWSL